jgi:hypothetical protein
MAALRGFLNYLFKISIPMIIQFAQKSYHEMMEELELFNEIGDLSVKKLQGSLFVIKTALDGLKDYLQLNPFIDQDEEVRFFKYEKPKILAEKIFALERYTIDSAVPLGDEEAIQQYFTRELAFIDRFFYQYRFLFQYYQLDASELDHLYFLRGGQPQGLLVTEQQEPDPQFSTACDHLYSKFMAYEKLQAYVWDRLRQPGGGNQTITVSKKGRELKWTGDKSNLVELAYGLYDTMQINNGDVDISDIIDWLEQTLQINLNRYYRRFSEIKSRKSISKTKFLDQMRDALMKHIEEGDAYKPQNVPRIRAQNTGK